MPDARFRGVEHVFEHDDVRLVLDRDLEAVELEVRARRRRVGNRVFEQAAHVRRAFLGDELLEKVAHVPPQNGNTR